MEKVRPWCGQPSDRGQLKNRTEQFVLGKTLRSVTLGAHLRIVNYMFVNIRLLWFLHFLYNVSFSSIYVQFRLFWELSVLYKVHFHHKLFGPGRVISLVLRLCGEQHQWHRRSSRHRRFRGGGEWMSPSVKTARNKKVLSHLYRNY